MVGSKQAVRGIAIWYNTAMFLLLTATILMMATTGTCLAQTGLPAVEAAAYYATNDIRIVTSADLARNDYVFTRTYKYVRFEGRVLDVFKDESRPTSLPPRTSPAAPASGSTARYSHPPPHLLREFDKLGGTHPLKA